MVHRHQEHLHLHLRTAGTSRSDLGLWAVVDLHDRDETATAARRRARLCVGYGGVEAIAEDWSVAPSAAVRYQDLGHL